MELRQRGPGRQTANGSPYHPLDTDDDKKRRGNVSDPSLSVVEEVQDVLGYRHWLLALIVLGSVYAAVVAFHLKLPPVRLGTDYAEFSEERARIFLREVTALGPRPSGSVALEKQAVPMLRKRLEQAQDAAAETGVNRVEIDTQHPTGCFDLKFLSAFTLCYENVTNVIARVGPKKGPADHALLLNCHIDTMPDTPGATDDAVSCAIMLEILDILAHSEQQLKYDVVFLFNGAEENFLQGAHGFIETHAWRHTIRAFINLEGTGSGGREILFQAGPGNSWLLKAYLESAPHPYCSILAQEIFQSGIIPSDTDFRIFRDFGRVSGLDIAYTRNGWVYHTEFDEEWRIDKGSIQRAGENVLGVPSKAAEQNHWVFYDVVGLFTVCYEIRIGVIANVLAATLSIGFVLLHLKWGLYSAGDLLAVFGRHTVVSLVMLLTGFLVALVVAALDLTMCWYSFPEMIGGLYVLPMLTAGLYVHSWFAANRNMRNAEMAHSDSVLVLLSFVLLAMTWAGLASAFFILNYLVAAVLRGPLICLLGNIGAIRKVSPSSILYVQLVTLIPAMVFAAYAISQCVDFFVPVVGRLGNAIHPEMVMAPLAFVIAGTFVLFTNNLVYISRPLNFGLRVLFLLFAAVLLILVTTETGFPYRYSNESPRLRRMIALHTHRTVFDFSGKQASRENALFVQTLDYRGAKDLPAHSFLQGPPPGDCAQTRDEYCRMPYYTAIHELFPPDQSVWVAVPGAPSIPFPIDIKLVERSRIGADKLNLTFELNGGFDKMSLHVTPLGSFGLHSWSFTPLDLDSIAKRDTYFVFLTYGLEAPPTRRFSLILHHTGSEPFPDVEKTPSLELAVASHHAHGKYQDSDLLSQLRTMIISRRSSAHLALGWWKWGITMIGGQSEIVVKQF